MIRSVQSPSEQTRPSSVPKQALQEQVFSSVSHAIVVGAFDSSGSANNAGAQVVQAQATDTSQGQRVGYRVELKGAGLNDPGLHAAVQKRFGAELGWTVKLSPSVNSLVVEISTGPTMHSPQRAQ